MSIRKDNFIKGNYYHIYNRGVDKRDIFCDQEDLNRFFQSIQDFNTENPIGSLYQESFRKKNNLLRGKASKSPLVDIVAYCVNSNHFHFILTPLMDNGIEKFMQRLGGYTMYFNKKYDRSGSLFQGKFKSKLVDSNEYLIHLSFYINFNNFDKTGSKENKLSKSSLLEYIKPEVVKNKFCNTGIVIAQFKSKNDYKKIGFGTWKEISRKKDQLKLFEI